MRFAPQVFSECRVGGFGVWKRSTKQTGKQMGGIPWDRGQLGNWGTSLLLMSRNSDGDGCADDHPDEADNPGFSEKQYSCEKNGVIHFCIMTG